MFDSPQPGDYKAYSSLIDALVSEVVPGVEPEVTDEQKQMARLRADQLKELGSVEGVQANFEAAMSFFNQALQLYQQVQDRRGESSIIRNLGTVHLYLGENERAEQHYLRALEIQQKNDLQTEEAATRTNLGIVYKNLGRYPLAIKQYEIALGIQRRCGNQKDEGVILGNLGTVYRSQGFVDKSIETHEMALSLHRTVGNRKSEASVLGNIGTLYEHQRDYEKAIEHYRQSLEIARDIGNRYLEGIHLGNLGEAYRRLNRPEAEDTLRKALEVCQGVFPIGVAVVRGSLSILLAESGRVEEALVLISGGEEQLQGQQDEHATFLCKKAMVLLCDHQEDLARECLQAAKAILEEAQVKDDSPVVRLMREVEEKLERSEG